MFTREVFLIVFMIICRMDVYRKDLPSLHKQSASHIHFGIDKQKGNTNFPHFWRRLWNINVLRNFN